MHPRKVFPGHISDSQIMTMINFNAFMIAGRIILMDLTILNAAFNCDLIKTRIPFL